MFDMAASPCIQCRIDPQLKLRLQAIAVEHGLTESAVLKRLVVGAIGMAPASYATVLAVEPIGRRARIYLRLRPGDHALLHERAAARGLASATYVSMLVRTHLRDVSPLPDRALAELRHSAGGPGRGGSESEPDRPCCPPARAGRRSDDRRPAGDAHGLRRIAGPFQRSD
jgi:hypothetical protein